MRIPQIRSELLRVQNKNKENQNKFQQIKIDSKIINIKKRQKNTKIFRICELQLKIHSRILQKDFIFN